MAERLLKNSCTIDVVVPFAHVVDIVSFSMSKSRGQRQGKI